MAGFREKIDRAPAIGNGCWDEEEADKKELALLGAKQSVAATACKWLEGREVEEEEEEEEGDMDKLRADRQWGPSETERLTQEWGPPPQKTE
uniref:Uncharacterized protein n=1 Tax=Oryza brachyantha TaxID=4533 RepID=J3NB50_ORYBR